jgi:stress-induced-phosphoprotein 1
VLEGATQVEEQKRKKEIQDYIDPAKAEEANELGKAAFQKADWPEAIKHYTEVCIWRN